MKTHVAALFVGMSLLAAGCGDGGSAGGSSSAPPSTATSAPAETPAPTTPAAAGTGEAPAAPERTPAEADGRSAAVDPALPRYEPSTPVDGTLRFAGSDTMGNIAARWTDLFRGSHPGVQPQVEAKGSSIGPPALMENRAQFAPMSRAMSHEEVDRFVATFGYPPTEIRAGIDALGIFVHKDNPIEELSLNDLAEAFSVSGGRTTWGDLGVEDSRWRDRPVQLYGRNSASGTYGFFKDQALGGSDFKNDVKENPGSAGVVNAVARDPYGLGYSGIGYRTPDVKVVRLAYAEGEEAFEPTPENANTGDYPLARFMYLYTNYDRRRELDPLRAEFLRLVFSQQGQEAVVQDGFYPVTADIAAEELAKVGLELQR